MRRGPSAYGDRGYGQLDDLERGIRFSGALEADGAPVAGALSTFIAASGDLVPDDPDLSGDQILVPPRVFAGSLQADDATFDGALSADIALIGGLQADASETDSQLPVFVNAEGGLLAGDSVLAGEIAAWIAAAGILESDPSAFDADVLVFKRRRHIQAIAY